MAGLDVLGCQAAAFEWAESFDSKDWDRLFKCLAPTLHVGVYFFRQSRFFFERGKTQQRKKEKEDNRKKKHANSISVHVI
jgi:hypothetical protein